MTRLEKVLATITLVVWFVVLFPGTTLLIVHYSADWSRRVPNRMYDYLLGASSYFLAIILSRGRLELIALFFLILFPLGALPDLPGVNGIHVDWIVCVMADVLKAIAFIWVVREIWLRIQSGQPLIVFRGRT